MSLEFYIESLSFFSCIFFSCFVEDYLTIELRVHIWTLFCSTGLCVSFCASSMCSSSLDIREIQSKNTLRYHLIPVRMAKINKTVNNKCWRRCGERGNFLQCWWECKLVQPHWKTVLPDDLAVALLDIYPKDTDVVNRRAIFTPTFIAAMATVAKLWKEPRCPSTVEWIKKMWSIYTMEYYASSRKDVYPTFV